MLSELKYWYLRNHKLFWVLNNSQVKQLCIITRFKTAKKGESVYLSTTDEPKIFFLKKGHIKITEIDDQGNEIIKDIIQKGDLFGELTLEPQQETGEQAIALSNDVVICSFLLKDFEELMTQYPSLALAYSKFVGFKLKRVRNSYNNLVFKDARTRLLHFLRDWFNSDSSERDGHQVVMNFLTQNEIAQIICTSRQTATQLINELEQEGIIRYDRKEIILLDPKALQ